MQKLVTDVHLVHSDVESPCTVFIKSMTAVASSRDIIDIRLKKKKEKSNM